MRPVIQVVMPEPISVAISSDPPAAAAATDSVPNCMNPATPRHSAISTAPKYGTRCSAAAASAQAPALSIDRYLSRMYVQSPSAALVMTSISM
ncbi:hypothetical protein D3C86_1452140 [compost metagenome]